MPASCAALSPTNTLAFHVPSTLPAADFALVFELGNAPTAGDYSSETIASWYAMATETQGTSQCFFVAGPTAVPPGSFTMTLDAIDATSAHGHANIQISVLPGVETDCGPSNVEVLDLRF